MLIPYISGLMASFGGCSLPVLSIIASESASDRRFKPVRFVFGFFISQFLLFAALNLSVSAFYRVFQGIQPILLALASLLTFYIATANYLGKSLPGLSGSVYGIALAPCNLGFAIFEASSSFSYLIAIYNALAFSLGISTPLIAIAFFVRDLHRKLIKHGDRIEKASFALLVLISYYLAYLAGSSWRWWP